MIYIREHADTIIDVIEDFLDRKGIVIPNPERDEAAKEDDSAANIYGDDYDDLQAELESPLVYLAREAGASVSEINTEDWNPDPGSSHGHESFCRKCYELYKLDWMQSHGHSLTELMNIFRKKAVDMTVAGCLDSDVNAAFDQLYDDFWDQGFGGELYVCYEEFRDAEYLDEGYMKHLLSDKEFEVWKDLSKR